VGQIANGRSAVVSILMACFRGLDRSNHPLRQAIEQTAAEALDDAVQGIVISGAQTIERCARERRA